MDAETNLTYATRYLAGAYRAAGGNESRAVALYASGYHGRGVPRERRVASSWQEQATPWPW
jgi:soluble lytic murein transglycosylase-like protein